MSALNFIRFFFQDFLKKKFENVFIIKFLEIPFCFFSSFERSIHSAIFLLFLFMKKSYLQNLNKSKPFS
jgi:hypothetical protein